METETVRSTALFPKDWEVSVPGRPPSWRGRAHRETKGALSRVRTSQGISARPLSFLRSHQLARRLHLLPGEGRQACQQD